MIGYIVNPRTVRSVKHPINIFCLASLSLAPLYLKEIRSRVFLMNLPPSCDKVFSFLGIEIFISQQMIYKFLYPRKA